MVGEGRLIVVLHNVHSMQRVIEFAKICYGLGYYTLVISRPIGTAAQVGVPEAQKVAFKMKGRLIVLPDLKDAIELLKPEKIILFAPKPYGKRRFNAEEIADQILKGVRVMVVFGGLEPGLSGRELSMGESVYLDVGEIGAVGLAAVTLYEIKLALKS
ncbi:MAG: RecB-family nuclease [archaeon GB-1845-036]|nr:RecB-family nuclease [Candidatus Culexmicrobium thermophilum]HDO20912.1 hypothetical protein [Candidatus Bathyarchaeota archaeon]